MLKVHFDHLTNILILFKLVGVQHVVNMQYITVLSMEQYLNFIISESVSTNVFFLPAKISKSLCNVKMSLKCFDMIFIILPIPSRV